MKALKKTSQTPSIRTMMEDFWDSGNIFNRMLGREMLPAVNIKETPQNFEIEVAAPGFQKQDFKIDMDDRVLNISAETRTEEEEKENNYTRKEFSYSSFNRSFTLPQEIKEDRIKAKYENGILHISLEKDQQAHPRKNIAVE